MIGLDISVACKHWGTHSVSISVFAIETIVFSFKMYVTGWFTLFKSNSQSFEIHLSIDDSTPYQIWFITSVRSFILVVFMENCMSLKTIGNDANVPVLSFDNAHERKHNCWKYLKKSEQMCTIIFLFKYSRGSLFACWHSFTRSEGLAENCCHYFNN